MKLYALIFLLALVGFAHAEGVIQSVEVFQNAHRPLAILANPVIAKPGETVQVEIYADLVCGAPGANKLRIQVWKGNQVIATQLKDLAPPMQCMTALARTTIIAPTTEGDYIIEYRYYDSASDKTYARESGIFRVENPTILGDPTCPANSCSEWSKTWDIEGGHNEGRSCREFTLDDPYGPLGSGTCVQHIHNEYRTVCDDGTINYDGTLCQSYGPGRNPLDDWFGDGKGGTDWLRIGIFVVCLMAIVYGIYYLTSKK